MSHQGTKPSANGLEEGRFPTTTQPQEKSWGADKKLSQLVTLGYRGKGQREYRGLETEGGKDEAGSLISANQG